MANVTMLKSKNQRLCTSIYDFIIMNKGKSLNFLAFKKHLNESHIIFDDEDLHKHLIFLSELGLVTPIFGGYLISSKF